jgi:NADPH-dependent 2,4-dienoyl-CoA reductase/sulfur reductase-like enzyme
MPKLFIIGGSDAGISAAVRAREIAPEWEVIAAVADRYPNFSICGIPYYLSREVREVDDLTHRKAADIERLGITLLLEHRIAKIDVDAHRVIAVRPEGHGSEFRYDKLIVATGASSVMPPIDGIDLPGVFLLRWIGDALAFEHHLMTRSPRHVIIVGGGYIGLEMSEALTHRGIRVTIVEMASGVMTTVDRDLGSKVENELRRNGVRLLTGQPISSIAADGGRLRIRGSEGLDEAGDMVLVAVGARPETQIAAAAGATRGVRGALKVNRRMETNVPNIFAAGDCAETWHRITENNTYLPLGTTAHKQGRIAGENAVGGHRLFEGSVGTQSVRLFDYVVARTGFHDRDAAAAGFDPLSADSVHWDHKVYYPGAREMTLRVTGDRSTGRLLGAQIVGHYGTEVSKRIDIFAAAIHKGMRVDELNDLDLSYTPPLSSPWDPVQMAAQAWESRRKSADRHAAAEPADPA